MPASRASPRAWAGSPASKLSAPTSPRTSSPDWTLEVERAFFSGVTGLALSTGREHYLLYSGHVAAELDDTGELRRLSGPSSGPRMGHLAR